MKKRVLFLCTGNSCRSQMAEGVLRHFYGDKYDVFSAGVNPATVNPNAIAVMKEIGIDISGQKSKSVNEFINQAFDITITACNNVKESCPIFPKEAEYLYWSFFDPAKASGTNEEILNIFRTVRDKIKVQIDKFVEKT